MATGFAQTSDDISCPDCDGTGHAGAIEDDPCGSCGGRGSIPIRYAKGGSWLEEDHPRDPDGEFALKVSKVTPKGDKFESLGHKAQTLFQTGGEKGQMNLFRDKGVPDELLPKELRGQDKPAENTSEQPSGPPKYTPGQLVHLPANDKTGMNALDLRYVGDKGDHAYVGWGERDYGPPDNWSRYSGMAVMPKESLHHFFGDLTGKVHIPASDDPHIEAVRQGKAEYLGKGDDGVAFGVGDKVVKMSTTVPFQPFNPGHRTPQEAMEMLAEDYVNNKMMRNDGIPGIPELKLKQVGDKAFLIGDRYEIPEKLTPDQLEQVRQSIEAMHKAGWAMNDQIQVGVDKQGKVWHFDTGKAEKKNSKWDQDGDVQNLRGLYDKHGVEYPSAAKEALEDWDSFHEMVAGGGSPTTDKQREAWRQEVMDANKARKSRMLQVRQPEREAMNAKFHDQITKLGYDPSEFFQPRELEQIAASKPPEPVSPQPAEPQPSATESPSEHWYGASLRPPGIATVPKGFGTVKPHDKFRHGAVSYPRKLTDQEIYDFELTPIRHDSEIPDVAKAVAETMGEYVGEYLKPENAEILDDKMNHPEVRKALGHVDVEKVKDELRRQHTAAQSATTQPEQTSTPTVAKPEIGDMVSFQIPSLNGPIKVAGRVRSVKQDGRFEIKTQGHGYHTVKPEDVTLHPEETAAPDMEQFTPKKPAKKPKVDPRQKALFRKRYAKENGGGQWANLGGASVQVDAQGKIIKGPKWMMSDKIRYYRV